MCVVLKCLPTYIFFLSNTNTQTSNHFQQKKMMEEKDRKNQTKDLTGSVVPIEGCYLPPSYHKYKEDIENFEVFDSDVWICTFPRSGTTWSAEMVWTIINDCDLEKAKASMFERTPVLDFGFLFHDVEHPDKYLFPPLVDAINFTKNRIKPRIIKTHLPIHLLPKQIRSGEKRPKIVYVCRNPMDVCVSYYHHMGSIDYGGKTETFYDLFLAEKVLYSPYWNHVLSAWKMKDQLNMLFLKYEEMKTDLPGVIRKTTTFLGKTLTDAQTEKLQKHLSFDSMKKNPSIVGGELIEFIRRGAATSPFVRAGIVGGYKNEMSEAYIEKFQKWMKDHMEGTGFSF